MNHNFAVVNKQSDSVNLVQNVFALHAYNISIAIAQAIKYARLRLSPQEERIII